MSIDKYIRLVLRAFEIDTINEDEAVFKIESLINEKVNYFNYRYLCIGVVVGVTSIKIIDLIVK